MIEEKGDLWTAAGDARCIPTNGSLVPQLGDRVRGVMGRGVARQAKDRYPQMESVLGTLVRDGGNHVYRLDYDPALGAIYSFPVKHRWMQNADLALIERSAHELMQDVDARGYTRVLVPRPGCGNGGLHWDIVKPIIASIFDDRIVVLEWA